MLPQRLDLPMMQVAWAQQLNPVISNELIQGQLLTNVSLVNGVNAVNHGLSRKLVGWIIVGINGPATIYDNQANNQMPQLTLSLTSSADVICNIWVF